MIDGRCAMIEARSAAVAFEHVSKSFGTKQVLHDVSFDVRPGEALCILGRSGTGKSVSLKLIISLIKPDQGKIWVEQDEITQLRESELSRVRLSQNGDPMVESPIVIEGYWNHGVPAEQLRFSRSRAMLVRQYLQDRLQLDPRNMGIVALKSSPPYATEHATWDGICIVLLGRNI